MPKLLLFAPCEKVIIDQDNNPSIIVLLQEISINMQIAGKLPAETTLAPMRWNIFALWGREDTDDPSTQYEASTNLVMPDGRVMMPASATFRLAGPSHRSIIQVMGFPLFQTPGVGEVRISLRRLADDGEAGELLHEASFPLRLKHHSSEKSDEQ